MQRGYAVVMPDGANYFYLDNEDTGEGFGRYVAQELVDVTRLMFPLSPLRTDTVIAGLSMGGFGALHNGFRCADSFGAVIALSPALITDEVAGMKPGYGNFMAPYGYYRHTFGEPEKLPGSGKDPKGQAKSCLEKGAAPRVFLACGKEDFLFPQNRDFHAYLASIGYPHAWWTRTGGHDFGFWNRAMPAALEWLAGS